MLDYSLYLLLCCGLAFLSFHKQLSSVFKDIYRLNQAWTLEKVGLYVLWEFFKILIIINVSFIFFPHFTLICYLGLVLYFLCSSLCFNLSQTYLVFFLWFLSFFFHIPAFQLSLAIFLSCLLLTGKKTRAILITNCLFPISLLLSSANIYFSLTCLLVLLIQAGKKYLQII